jgi:hypothetical protein
MPPESILGAEQCPLTFQPRVVAQIIARGSDNGRLFGVIVFDQVHSLRLQKSVRCEGKWLQELSLDEELCQPASLGDDVVEKWNESRRRIHRSDYQGRSAAS